MTLQLSPWQHHLERHFTELATARRASGQPLFALEHNLSSDELAQVAAALRTRGVTAAGLRPYWLIWIVYAAEHGYRYEGGEYWPAFEKSINGWQASQHRSQLRFSYKKFAETFGGIWPTGRWAECFTNIAWPITHAVLPKYLQFQFARILHAARYDLASVAGLSPVEAGMLLSNHSYNTSARFEEFLEQQEVAGRILLAMISDHATAGPSPLYPPTLERIIMDLERERVARDYLRETRNYIAARIHGGAPGHPSEDPRNSSTRRDTSIRRSIKPLLLLRRSSPGSWTPLLEFPSLAEIANLDPATKTFLKTTRCKVLGSDQSWLPAGWLSLMDQRRVLYYWPVANQPLLSFEQSDKQPSFFLRNLIADECRLTPGPRWLCRIRSDGLAAEVVTRTVRPGQDYIVLSTQPIPDAALVKAASINCRGIYGYELKMPAALSREQIADLEQFGLRVARTVEIWPAGLPARGWDGDGQSEWLTSETPCFGLKHDHPVDSFLVRLGSGPERKIAAAGPGQPVFVKLPKLPAGSHSFSITAQRSNVALHDTKAHLALFVREPKPWIPGTTSHAGLTVLVDPPDADLDTLWEGRAKFTLLGPDQRQISCRLDLFQPDGTSFLSESINTYTLPVGSREISSSFRAAQERHHWDIVEASYAQVCFSGEDLGQYLVRFNRNLNPLRWICRRAGNALTLRLVDDTGTEEGTPPDVKYFEFSTPLTARPLPYQQAVAGLFVEGRGAMYHASHGGHVDTVLVKQVSGLGELKIPPLPPALASQQTSAHALLIALALWTRAKPADYPSSIQRDHTAACIQAGLVAALCGDAWARAEARFAESPRQSYDIDSLKSGIENASYAAALKIRAGEFDQSASGRKKFAEISKRYKISSDLHECEFAYVWAHDPLRLLKICADVDERFAKLAAAPLLSRGARLVSLLASLSEKREVA